MSCLNKASFAEAREKLLALIKKFIYEKCHCNIDAIVSRLTKEDEGTSGSDKARQHLVGVGIELSLTTRTVGETDFEFHEKVQSLQFVSPIHLEIGCLIGWRMRTMMHHQHTQMLICPTLFNRISPAMTSCRRGRCYS